jgi:hypothetical protein
MCNQLGVTCSRIEFDFEAMGDAAETVVIGKTIFTRTAKEGNACAYKVSSTLCFPAKTHCRSNIVLIPGFRPTTALKQSL